MSWRCEGCGAVVSDMNKHCPSCSAVSPSVSSTDVDPTGSDGPLEARDAEGYTGAERAARRPLREIAGAHLLAAQRARRRWNNRRPKGGRQNVLEGAVAPGSVRVSRPMFSPVKH